VESGEHLARCVVYVDLNMVRAAVVQHPAEWEVGGYHEIQREPMRYRIIDRAALAQVLGVKLVDLAAVHREWVEEALGERRRQHEGRWSESIAVGSRSFVENIRRGLGSRGRYRSIVQEGEDHVLRESEELYRGTFSTKSAGLSLESG
jgi:putative transposase